ncbi:MAG TPA: helix-turn-helix domain-containing protein [Candidatus Limnocylindria bacterium]
MTSVVDVWRAVDPEARLLAGSSPQLLQPIRTVLRSRAVAPHLPEPAEAALLVLDAATLQVGSIADLLAALGDARLEPAAIMLTGVAGLEAGEARLPILVSERPQARLVAEASAYLADEPGFLARLTSDLRLACAEAALGDPQLTTPAGLVAARIDRGVAIAVDGELVALHPRAAGRALAARFAALHARLLSAPSSSRRASLRQTREGLWLAEGRIRPGASAWLFDDRPLAAVDEVAVEALTATARALLRRPPAATPPPTARAAHPPPARQTAPPSGDPLEATLLAVARANGRVAPAARALGVHRNTVLYRLRRALAERGIDPRRPQDALRLLADVEGKRPTRTSGMR